MKNKAKKKLEARGIIAPRSEGWRVEAAPGAQTHADRRNPNRATQKRALKLQWQQETARNRGPFPFSGSIFGFGRLTQGKIFC